MMDSCTLTTLEDNLDKVVNAMTCLEYLGIVIDSENMIMKISQERLNDTLQELNRWLEVRYTTKRKLLSLIGKLDLLYICKVVRLGRTFLRRLIERSKHAKHLQYRLKVNNMVRDDIN